MVGRTHGNDPASHGRHRRVLAWVMCALAALLAAQAARLGASGLFSQNASVTIERWEREHRPARQRDYALVESDLHRALVAYPDNPWALGLRAQRRFEDMRAARSPAEAEGAVRKGLNELRTALPLRPMSPYLWANLALGKMYLREFDTEFQRALSHASTLGPWEPAVLELLVFVGLASWSSLDADDRRLIVSAIDRGSARQPGKILEILKGFHRRDLICSTKRYNVQCAHP